MLFTIFTVLALGQKLDDRLLRVNDALLTALEDLTAPTAEYRSPQTEEVTVSDEVEVGGISTLIQSKADCRNAATNLSNSGPTANLALCEQLCADTSACNMYAWAVHNSWTQCQLYSNTECTNPSTSGAPAAYNLYRFHRTQTEVCETDEHKLEREKWYQWVSTGLPPNMDIPGPTLEVMRAYTAALVHCARADGLSAAELQFIRGHQLCFGAGGNVVDAIFEMKKMNTDEVFQKMKENPDLKLCRKVLIYHALEMSAIDGMTGLEFEEIKKIAVLMDMEPEVVDELYETQKADEQQRKRKMKAIWGPEWKTPWDARQ